MINWPAVIKYDGDDELIYIGSNEIWLRDAEAHLYNHNGNDCLIDSNGDIFSLDPVHDNERKPVATGNRIGLQEFIKLVRIHASSSHRCCIDKIYFRSIAEGIGLIASMNEDEQTTTLP